MTSPASLVYIMQRIENSKENGRGVECYSGERGSSRRRDCVAFLDFLAKTQEV